MSGQWEVVSKKKGDKAPKLLNNKTNKEANNKKPVLNVNIEDVLPKSQLKNLFSNAKNDDDTKKTQEKPKGPDNKPKPQKKEKVVQEPPKPKPPKSIESALNSINTNDLKTVYEKTKTNFPDAPIVWLKELAQYLNQKMPLEIADPVFSNKTQSYPLALLPQELKKILDKATLDAGRDNTQLFFDISITAMVTDMSKNSSALGHKLFLQYLARKEPSLAVASLKKHIELKNSYQNRPNIGLSILWAVGQSGFVDFQCGLKAFEELMLPLIQFKNYTKFIVKYLIDIVNSAKGAITREQYLMILEALYWGAQKNFPNDLKKSLTKTVEKLKLLVLEDAKKGKFINIVDSFIRKLNNNDNNLKSYQECLCDIIVDCFESEISCFDIWNQIFIKNAKGSAILLQYVYHNWNNVSIKINHKAFNELLASIENSSQQVLVKKKKDIDLNQVVALTEKLKERMTVKNKPRSSFKLLVVLLALTIAGAVYFDTQQNGGWSKSNTKRLMKEYRVCEYGHKGWSKIVEGWSWVDGQIDRQLPGYKVAVVEYTEPYVQLFSDLGLILKNVLVNIKRKILMQYPYFVQTIDSYAPGLIENSQNVVTNVWSTSVLYVNRSMNFLKHEVFVGQLSPENVHKVVLEALNSTQTKATEYYHWLYEKVQTTIK